MHGGKRKRAGRPKGSTKRPQIRDYFTADDVEKLVAELKKRAKKDNSILKFLGEQMFGKAVQPISGPDDGPIKIQGVNISVRK